jgi:hypothetical protein
LPKAAIALPNVLGIRKMQIEGKPVRKQSRFTRVTNAFSKKFSTAMAAGLSDTLWSIADLAEMIDAAALKPGKRGPYWKKEHL